MVCGQPACQGPDTDVGGGLGHNKVYEWKQPGRVSMFMMPPTDIPMPEIPLTGKHLKAAGMAPRLRCIKLIFNLNIEQRDTQSCSGSVDLQRILLLKDNAWSPGNMWSNLILI